MILDFKTKKLKPDETNINFKDISVLRLIPMKIENRGFHIIPVDDDVNVINEGRTFPKPLTDDYLMDETIFDDIYRLETIVRNTIYHYCIIDDIVSKYIEGDPVDVILKSYNVVIIELPRFSMIFFTEFARRIVPILQTLMVQEN